MRSDPLQDIPHIDHNILTSCGAVTRAADDALAFLWRFSSNTLLNHTSSYVFSERSIATSFEAF